MREEPTVFEGNRCCMFSLASVEENSNMSLETSLSKFHLLTFTEYRDIPRPRPCPGGLIEWKSGGNTQGLY